MFLAKNKKLLDAFKRGDREAMDVVYRHYHRGVTSFLRKGFTFRSGSGHFFFKGIQDPSEVKNAVQEVFRRAFEERARNSYNGVNSFSNWVLAIGRNMVINQFRNREIAFSDYIAPTDERGHLTVMDDEITEEFSGVLYGRPAEAQDSEFEHGELKKLIDAFTAELSEHDRKLLVLRFAEGLGQEETAKLLGSTRMKVRTSESRLRSRLRAYLRHSGYIDHLVTAAKGDRAALRGALPLGLANMAGSDADEDGEAADDEDTEAAAPSEAAAVAGERPPARPGPQAARKARP